MDATSGSHKKKSLVKYKKNILALKCVYSSSSVTFPSNHNNYLSILCVFVSKKHIYTYTHVCAYTMENGVWFRVILHRFAQKQNFMFFAYLFLGYSAYEGLSRALVGLDIPDRDPWYSAYEGLVGALVGLDIPDRDAWYSAYEGLSRALVGLDIPDRDAWYSEYEGLVGALVGLDIPDRDAW